MLDVPHPPWSRIIYLADLAHFPYGPRPIDEVRRLALAGVTLLARRGADVVAVACNTASSSGLSGTVPGVRAASGAPVPLVDIIGPGAREVARLAAARPGTRVIVLGTEGTIRSGVWEEALRRARFHGPVTGWPCPFLANLIEEGVNGAVARSHVHETTRGLVGLPEGPVVVVLGCTHYPFAAATIADVLSNDILGRPVSTVDPSGALVAELDARLRERSAPVPVPEGSGRVGGERPADAATAGRPSEIRTVFLTTGRAAHFAARARQLLADHPAGGSAALELDEVEEVTLEDLPT